VRPPRTEARPRAVERSKVERRLPATREAAITGRTINAAMRRMPTTRIESATVRAARPATTTLRAPMGTPATRAPCSSRTAAASAR
jgi:hypothetical protein